MPFEKGHKLSKGRPTKVDEEKTNYFILEAVKQIKNVETEDEAKIAIVIDLYSFERGKIFIAEHVFGKPKETVDLGISKVPIVDMSSWK